MDEKTTLKTWTIMETLVGGVGFLVALIISSYYKRVVFIDRSPAVCYTVWDAVDW